MLRSLTMLLASGVDMNGFEVVPVIIDPDYANADLTRNVSVIDKYVKIRQYLSFSEGNKNTFFKTNVISALQNYQLPVHNTNNQTFEDFINLQGMSTRENKAMAMMLFSDANLASNMEVGFKGNPNIGSVVLNQITTSNEFAELANRFQPGDRIFIINSIFGGTGASGFPLLLKTFRIDNNIPNHQAINQSEIGAVTVLPYFKLEKDPDSAIDSATFISKTKSALAYYEKNIANTGQINALYLIGNYNSKTYKNEEGGIAQKNDAHIVEFLSATAIVDFVHRDNAGQSQYYEVGLNTNGETVTVNNLYDGLASMVRTPMTQFAFMTNAFNVDKSFIESSNLNRNAKLGFDATFYGGSFMRNVREFLDDYQKWLQELKTNTPSLDFFNLGADNPFEMITDVKAKKKMGFISPNRENFRSSLNNAKVASKNKEDNLMEMYCDATNTIIKEKFNF